MKKQESNSEQLPTPEEISEKCGIRWTELQKEEYNRAVQGTMVQFRGQVSEVHKNGDVILLIREDSVIRASNIGISLKGVPYDELRQLRKSHSLTGTGRILEAVLDQNLFMTVAVLTLKETNNDKKSH